MRTVHAAAVSDGSPVAHEYVAKASATPAVTATMNCDGIARFYRLLEYLSFGGMLQDCRVMYLREVADCRRALVCGDGDGRFLAQLLRANRTVRVDYVDLSAGMVELARRRVEAMGQDASARTQFNVADIRRFTPSDTGSDDGSYDIITAHFFLDCFDDAEAASVARGLASFARAGATLLVSDFRIPPRGIARYVAAAMIRGLYGAFRIATGLRVTRLPNYESALERAAFRKERETLKLGGLLAASLWRKN
jgi:ubiquinone/menaquinone biosynthesis C-methylase UbiE